MAGAPSLRTGNYRCASRAQQSLPTTPGDGHSGSPRGRGWGAHCPPWRPLRSGSVRSAQGPGGRVQQCSWWGRSLHGEMKTSRNTRRPNRRWAPLLRWKRQSCFLGLKRRLGSRRLPKVPGHGTPHFRGGGQRAGFLPPGPEPGPAGSAHLKLLPEGGRAALIRLRGCWAARVRPRCWEGPRRVWTRPRRPTPGIGPALLLITPHTPIPAAWPTRGVC